MLGMYSQQGIFMQHEKGLISSAQFRDSIRGQITQEVTDEQIDAAWNSFLVDIPRFKLDMLLKLREKYVVYLLSNTNEIHWKWACEHAFPYRGFRVEDYFEKMYLSYEMKMVKPAEEINQYTTKIKNKVFNSFSFHLYSVFESLYTTEHAKETEFLYPVHKRHFLCVHCDK